MRRRLALGVVLIAAFATALPAFASHAPGTRTVLIAPLPDKVGAPPGQPGILFEGGHPGQPLVVMVPDHVGADHRAWFHTDALLDAGLDVLVIEPAATGPGAMLGALFSALAAARSGADGLDPPRLRVGLFGFGGGGEAALLAGFETTVATHLGPDGPRFDAHAALYPTCGPDLSKLLQADAAPEPTPAPTLILQPWAEAPPGRGGWDCSPLTAEAAPAGRSERVTVQHYDWAGYGFDLEPGSPRHALPHPTGEGILWAVPEPGAAELARRAIADFLGRALSP